MYCSDLCLKLRGRISSGVLWATSNCSVCSDIPTTEFSLSPGRLRVWTGEHLPFEMVGFGEFGLCFHLLITLGTWRRKGGRGGDHCQQVILATFTLSIRSLTGFLFTAGMIYFLTCPERTILVGDFRCSTSLFPSSRPISELSLFSEPVVEMGCKWQLWHKNPFVHYLESVFVFFFLQPFIYWLLNVVQCILLKTNIQLKWHGP